MRALKLLGFVIGGLITLVAAAVVAVVLLVDPNDFKDRIVQAAKAATGRDLSIRGTIELKLFPQLALGVNDASLGNPAGFGDAPFATVRHLALRVAVMPLLRKQLDVGRIEVDGLDLRLAKNAEGKGNWEDFGQKPGADEGTAQGGLGSLELKGLRVTESRLQYNSLLVGNIDLDVGRMAPRSAVPVKLALDLKSGPDGIPLHIGGSLMLTPDLEKKQFSITALALAGTVTPKSAAKPVDWQLTSPALELDLQAQTLGRTQLQTQLGLARVSLTVAGSLLFDAPQLEGQLKLDPLALREWLLQLGVKAPESLPTQLGGQFDFNAAVPAKQLRLTQVALDGQVKPGPTLLPWSFASPSLSLDLADQSLADTAFLAKLGAAQLSGRITGTKLLDAPALRGSVALKPLALRELMGQFGITPPVTRDAKVLSSLALSGRFAYAGKRLQTEGLDMTLDDTTVRGQLGLDIVSGAKTFDLSLNRLDVDRYLPPPTTTDKDKKAPFEVPTAILKALRAKGMLTIGDAVVSGVKLSSLQLGLDAADGVTQMSPVRAQLYGGQYVGRIGFDARPATPQITLDQSMTNIDIARLLGDFAQTKRLSGKGNLSMSVTAQGANGDAIMKTVRGQASASLVGGAVEGIDLWFGIAQAQSLVQQRTLSSTPNTKRTSFDSFKASADIVDGVATTKDLAISSQLLRVAGQGNTNLVTQTLDYALDVTVLKTPPSGEAAELALATIPVKVTGQFDDPKVRPDFGGIVKARVQKEIEKRKDEVKEKVQEKLQDALKGLFGR